MSFCPLSLECAVYTFRKLTYTITKGTQNQSCFIIKIVKRNSQKCSVVKIKIEIRLPQNSNINFDHRLHIQSSDMNTEVEVGTGPNFPVGWFQHKF